MESKKINQLATELAPELSDLTIIGDPTTGISKKITLSQMASLFTGTVEEYANLASFPLVGTADTIYIALDTNIIYRWNTGTSAYVELSPNIVTSLVFNDANGFDGTISLVGSTATLTITTALTQGSIGFIGASGALTQDNSNFYWDNTNKRLGINTNAPTTAIDAFGSGIIGRLNGTSTNNAFLGFASAGTNKWSIGNVQSDHRFRIYSEANTAELVSVLQTGEFGIGIANPTTKLHIDGGASALIANLDANVSVAKSVSFRSDNSARFNIEVSGTESGSNAGANFFIRRYSDAGALIDTPLTITRSTGIISFATALSGTSATFTGNITLGSTLQNTYHYFKSYAGTGTQQIAVIGTNSTANGGYLKIINDSSASGVRGIRLGVNGNGVAPENGVDVITVLDTANVGINENNPTYKLQVGGNLYTSSYIVAEAVGFIGVIAAYTSDFVSFSHTSRSGVGAYSFLSGKDGTTIVNASTGKTIDFRINNTTKVQINSTGFTTITGPAYGNIVSWTDAANNTGYLSIRAAAASIGADNNLVFETAATERMRITSGGDILLGGNTTYGGVGISIRNKNTYNTGMLACVSGDNSEDMFYFYSNTSTLAGIIGVNGNTTSYYSVSDYRAKQDLKDFNGLDIISKFKMYDFEWILDGTRNFGGIAHEIQEILPYAVTGEKDGERNQAVDYSKLVPVLVKAIQEQQAQIEELKNK